jgi:hypothetical protein
MWCLPAHGTMYATSWYKQVRILEFYKTIRSTMCMHDEGCWLRLVGSILTIRLNEHKDSSIWTTNKNFSLKNMYNDLVIRTKIPFNYCTWKAKIPLKIKIFL